MNPTGFFKTSRRHISEPQISTVHETKEVLPAETQTIPHPVKEKPKVVPPPGPIEHSKVVPPPGPIEHSKVVPPPGPIERSKGVPPPGPIEHSKPAPVVPAAAHADTGVRRKSTVFPPRTGGGAEANTPTVYKGTNPVAPARTSEEFKAQKRATLSAVKPPVVQRPTTEANAKTSFDRTKRNSIQKYAPRSSGGRSNGDQAQYEKVRNPESAMKTLAEVLNQNNIPTTPQIRVGAKSSPPANPHRVSDEIKLLTGAPIQKHNIEVVKPAGKEHGRKS